jgi:hypothetical protein
MVHTKHSCNAAADAHGQWQPPLPPPLVQLLLLLLLLPLPAL